MNAARALAVVLGATLAGCASAPPHDDAPFPLLPPASLGQTLERQQRLHLTSADTQAAFQCVLRVTPQEIVVIGLGPMGQRAFSVRYDGTTVHAETAPQASGVPPAARMLADLQMALWPAAVLDVGLAGTAWEVLEPRPGVREVRRAGRKWAEIRYDGAAAWDGRLQLENLAHGYTLAVESSAIGG